MKLLLKRDTTGSSHPSGDQLEVGELVMNSVTGKLYSKLTDGSIVEWIGQKICFDPAPEIVIYYDNVPSTNDYIDSFCCLGGILEFEVTKLKLEPEEYIFTFTELTANSDPSNLSVQQAKYSNYTIPKPGSTTNETILVRKAIVPVNVAILNESQPISIFKFSVISQTMNNKILTEKIITLKCQDITT